MLSVWTKLVQAGFAFLRATSIITLLFMDPVSRNLDHELMDSGDGKAAVADLKSQLGALQIGGGGDMLIDEYDVVDDKPDVTNISPDDSAEEPEMTPLADDCMCIQRKSRRGWPV